MKYLMRRLIWLGVGFGAKHLLRRGAAKTLDSQREQLAERLPTPVVKLADRMPVDPIRAGSSLVVVSKASRAAATSSQKATRRAAGGIRAVGQLHRRLSDVSSNVRAEFQTEVVDSVRSMRSQYLGVTEGKDAATDALLDIRTEPLGSEELPEVPAPISRGRRRWSPGTPTPQVNRMQRSYFPPIKPWNRRR